ncbi:DNA-directed RNA polymerase subunit omega [Moorella sulfitireducens (nom. illeg.)]|uniref:DNA-directed RNA polymerase subunit omega n=1 Tax=Neomoorella sulfitireducens TaxID=2972948 RepID=UPI0021AC61F7|nr:DNA-directed RNA polymerase subunit omega [Moorella sulfitireducens]
MKQPSLDELEKRIGSKYALAVLAAKRARSLSEGQFAEIYPKGTKPVTVALLEIAEGKIKYEWGKKKA